MTISNTQSPKDNQTEKIIDSLRYEIASLNSRLKKKDERIATLDTMLNQVMESHSVQVRAYEDLEGKLEDVVEMLRKRVPHLNILDFLKVKDSDEMRSYPI